MAREIFIQGFLLTILMFVLASSTLLFGIHYGRTTSLRQFEQCPEHHTHQSAVVTSPMWDVSHVPNPPPVYSPKVFTPISDLDSFKSSEAAANDTSWESLLTPGGGFLQVEKEDGGEVGFGVSMFHQLHCLVMIRSMLLGQPMSHAHEASDWSEDNMHWLHCLDYLAQVFESPFYIVFFSVSLRLIISC